MGIGPSRAAPVLSRPANSFWILSRLFMIAPATAEPAVNQHNSRHRSRKQRRRDRERARRVESRVIDEAGYVSDESPIEAEPIPASAALACIDSEPEATDSAPEPYVRAGFVRRLFGRGQRTQDAQTGAVKYDEAPGLLRPFARREYRREAAISTMREGFETLSNLMTDLRDGLDASVEKQSELLEHLKFLPVVAEQNQRAAQRFDEQAAATNRLQAETISAIREQIQGQRQHHEQLNEVLGTMTRESRDQKRDLDDVQGRLERLRTTDQAIADNLASVGRAVRQVSGQAEQQSDLVRTVQQAFDDRARFLEQNLARQARRQGMLTLGVLLTLLAGAAAAGFAYARSIGML